MLQPVMLIHLSIARPWAEVYAYVSDPRNLPQWAAGLSRTAIRQDGERWVADSPMGEVGIRFVPPNAFGVVDHDVTLPDGTTVTNPLRVQANGDGAEVIFTLHLRPGVSQADFTADAVRIRTDLAKLKRILGK